MSPSWRRRRLGGEKEKDFSLHSLRHFFTRAPTFLPKRKTTMAHHTLNPGDIPTILCGNGNTALQPVLQCIGERAERGEREERSAQMHVFFPARRAQRSCVEGDALHSLPSRPSIPSPAPREGG